MKAHRTRLGPHLGLFDKEVCWGRGCVEQCLIGPVRILYQIKIGIVYWSQRNTPLKREEGVFSNVLSCLLAGPLLSLFITPPVLCEKWERRDVLLWAKIAIWLILPVVIRLSQRLSHACLSINNSILWNCVRLIKPVIVYLIFPYYSDTRSNSRANTCVKQHLLCHY